MTTLRGIAQPSDCLLTHMLLAYWRKLLYSRSSYVLRRRFVARHTQDTSQDRVMEQTELRLNGVLRSSAKNEFSEVLGTI